MQKEPRVQFVRPDGLIDYVFQLREENIAIRCDQAQVALERP